MSLAEVEAHAANVVAAPRRVVRRIHSTLVGGWDVKRAEEPGVETVDRIRQFTFAVVIDVRGVITRRGEGAQEDLIQDIDAVGLIDHAVGVDVRADETGVTLIGNPILISVLRGKIADVALIRFRSSSL